MTMLATKRMLILFAVTMLAACQSTAVEPAPSAKTASAEQVTRSKTIASPEKARPFEDPSSALSGPSVAVVQDFVEKGKSADYLAWHAAYQESLESLDSEEPLLSSMLSLYRSTAQFMEWSIGIVQAHHDGTLYTNSSDYSVLGGEMTREQAEELALISQTAVRNHSEFVRNNPPIKLLERD